MALHHVAVETPVEAGAALKIDLVARLKQPEVGLLKSLADGGDGVGVAVGLHHREAHAVV